MTATTVARRPTSGTLAEVVDIILDKGLVIDAYVRVSLVGIELVTIDARVVVASVDTYLHFAEAVNRLDLRAKADEYDADIQELMSGMASKGAEAKTEGVLEGAGDKVKAMFGADDGQEQEEQEAED